MQDTVSALFPEPLSNLFVNNTCDRDAAPKVKSYPFLKNTQLMREFSTSKSPSEMCCIPMKDKFIDVFLKSSARSEEKGFTKSPSQSIALLACLLI